MYTGRVWVPSIGRSALKNATIDHLKMAMDPQNIAVVTSVLEAEAYARLGVHIKTCDTSQGLSHVLQWILGNAYEGRPMIVMDDDLRFAARDTFHTSLHQITPQEMEDMLNWLDGSIGKYVHAGISARQGNNNEPLLTKEVTSMRSVLAYDPYYLRSHGIRFDRCVSKADYDVTLRLLELGQPNIVSYQFTHDQMGGPNLAGGTTEYRTFDMHHQAAEQLRNLHPRVVDMVYKEKKEWKNTGGGRWDVRVQWRQAYKGVLSEGE